MNIWICDTETTGLTQPAGAVELGLLQIDENLNILRQHESLVNPGILIEPGASEIHKITDDMLIEAPTVEAFFQEMRDDGADFSDVCFIAHNERYDFPFYAPHMQINLRLCTLALARRDLRGLMNYKLGTVAMHCGVHVPEDKAHTAMGDVLAVYGILKAIVESTGRSLPTLMGVMSKPVMLHTMSFGKFQGRSIMSIPRKDRDYMLANYDLDKDMKYTLETLKKTGA